MVIKRKLVVIFFKFFIYFGDHVFELDLCKNQFGWFIYLWTFLPIKWVFFMSVKFVLKF